MNVENYRACAILDTLNLKLLKWQFLKIEVTMLIFYLIFFQLWDIRDGMCKQTFPGHESDINAVTVKQLVILFLVEISNADQVVNHVLFIISPHNGFISQHFFIGLLKRVIYL